MFFNWCSYFWTSLNTCYSFVEKISWAINIWSQYVALNFPHYIYDVKKLILVDILFLERSATYIFLQRMDVPLPHSYATTPIRWMSHSGLILGERTMKPATNVCQESGYQPLRLATELVPATFAAIGPKIISPFWSVLFYFVFIMFGIAQQVRTYSTHCRGENIFIIQNLVKTETFEPLNSV